MDKPSILIIESDAFLASLYGRKFEKEGWQVIMVNNFSEAKKILKNKKVSAAILEPDIDQKAAEKWIRELRKEPARAALPLLILSTMAEKEVINRFRKVGADGYLIKGHFVPREVVRKLKSLINQN